MDNAAKGEMLEAKDLYSMFTLDGIATAGFGIETNSFKDPDNIFRKTALKMVRAPGYSSWTDWIEMFAIMFLPGPIKAALKLDFFPKGTLEFFADIVKKAMDHRKATGERRNDIIDLILDQMKEGKEEVKEDTEDDFEKNAAIDTSGIKKTELDKELVLIAQALIFFFAGFDTTSLGLSAIIGCLVHNQDVQDRVREEIIEVTGESETFTFEHLQNMKYLDNVMNESFRFTNANSFLERVCTRDYRIPDSDYVIRKGDNVQFWNGDFVKDPENFYDPENFNPDNWESENNPDKFTQYMFGQGPRNCVGMRFATLGLKIAVVHTLTKFKLNKCEKTVDKMEVDPASIQGSFKGGVWFRPEIIQ